MSIDEQLKGLSSHTPAMDASDNVAAVGSRHGSINEASPYPATITEGFLWLGDHKHASTDGVMRDLKITHVVDAAHDDPAGEIRRGQYSDLTYLVIRVNDDESSDLTAAFADSHRFINECRAASGRCLVHCKAGKSRSVSLVVHHLVAVARRSPTRGRGRPPRGPRRADPRLPRAAARGAAPRRRADHRRTLARAAPAARQTELAHERRLRRRVSARAYGMDAPVSPP